MSNHKQLGSAFWATTALAVVFAAIAVYAAAYFNMAAPYVHSSGTMLLMAAQFGPVELQPVYSENGFGPNEERYQKLFAPAHWVDVRLRPGKWIFELPKDLRDVSLGK